MSLKTILRDENNLIIKKFAFEVFNNYTALIITAFFKGTYFKCDGGFSGDSGNCLGDLEELLVPRRHSNGNLWVLNIIGAQSAHRE